MLQSLIPYLHYSQTYLHQLLLRQHRGHPCRENRLCLKPFLLFCTPIDNDHPWKIIEWDALYGSCFHLSVLMTMIITRTSISFITSSLNCSNLLGNELIFVLSIIITLFMFLNLRFLIPDKGSREASFMDFPDLLLNLFSSAKLSELDFVSQVFSE